MANALGIYYILIIKIHIEISEVETQGSIYIQIFFNKIFIAIQTFLFIFNNL